MNIPLVYAITLNWNRCRDTLECLGSLTQITYSNLRILVVDNASTDGSPQSIAEKFPSVEQIVNVSNLGFAAGFNVGVRRALSENSDYVFVLNNDTTVASDALDLLLAVAKPQDVGMVAPAIYYASNPEKIWSTGGRVSRITLEMLGNHGRQKSIDRIIERDFLSGCGMLIKRSVLERVGLFDERFFLFYEDSDYSLRVRRAGFRLLVVPQARMWHKVSSSTEGTDSPTERYWMGYSSVLFFRKHARKWQLPIIFVWRFGSAIKTIGRLTWTGRQSAARTYMQGIWDALRRVKRAHLDAH